MAEVIGLGEVMIRLTPPGALRLEQTVTLDLDVGGAELNTMVGLSRLGIHAAWLSKLPDTPLGRVIANRARSAGVDTSPIIWTPEGRAGLYFVEQGAAPRAGQVFYDRRDSAMSTLGPEEIDPALFHDARLFHVSGITPALSQRCREATFAAVRAAREAGCLVSFDPNYRSRLWTLDEARAVYVELLPQVDILFATREALQTFFSIAGDDDEAAAHAALAAFGNLKAVALTSREQAHAFRGTIGALAAVNGQTYHARNYEMEIIDRLGAGDAFASGFLWGFLRDDPARGVVYGQAMAALQHTIPGDFPWFTLDEVAELAEASGGGTMRLRR